MSTNTQIRYPDVEVQLSGEDGNGFMIAARVRKAIERHIRDTADEDQDRSEVITEAQAIGKEFFDEALSGDYNNLLSTSMRWVTVL